MSAVGDGAGLHPRRQEDPIPDEALPRRAAHLLDDQREAIEGWVGVLAPRARLEFEPLSLRDRKPVLCVLGREEEGWMVLDVSVVGQP